MTVNRNSTYEERVSSPRIDEIACDSWYRSKHCKIEKFGWDLLHRRDLGKFFFNMPHLFSDVPDFMACDNNQKYMLVESKTIAKNGICWSIKVKHWEAYKEWFKLCEDKGMDFYFFFFNEVYGSINAPFVDVQKIIEEESEIELFDEGTSYEKETYRFSIRGLERYNVKRW